MNEADLLAIVEKTLDEVLPPATERPLALSEAMRYAVGSGGKRIRPLICLGAAAAVGGKVEDAAYPAAAIELMHNYTLVHDDLPAMDNDVERRGRPTVWKRFGEANAILVGDALASLCFSAAARAPRNVGEIIAVLGEMGVGVVRGQVEDVAAAAAGERADDDFVYVHKTSDLFIAAAKTGALAAGGSAESVAALGRFALSLGLAFQYEDDLLDGDGAHGREETALLARSETDRALSSLAPLPGDTSILRHLAERLVGRTV